MNEGQSMAGIGIAIAMASALSVNNDSDDNDNGLSNAVAFVCLRANNSNGKITPRLYLFTQR